MFFCVIIIIIIIIAGCSEEKKIQHEPTRANESSYNQNIRAATTSIGLTKADIAWHALNTYGWGDCSEVIGKSEKLSGGYYVIECSSGTKLRFYSRANQHPKITNIDGGYN